MAQIICYPYKKLQSCNIGDTVLAPTFNGTYDIGHDVNYHLGSVTTLTPDGNYTVSGLSGEYHASELISATITA